MMAEGEKVWMQFNLRGTHQASFYGFEATGRRVEMPEVGTAYFAQVLGRDISKWTKVIKAANIQLSY